MVAQPATLPPAGLPGLEPSWSRLVDYVDSEGVPRTWHVLDNWPDDAPPPARTLVCVHGNPTWSYLWRSLLATAPAGVRVVAVDQLGMGFSERIDGVRRLADRVRDLGAVIDTVVPEGPVVIVAHDWGGPISLGWCIDHPERVEGIVLLNTAVHQPQDALPPAVIRLARAKPLLRFGTSWTQAFLRTTTALSGRSITRDVARAYALPYRSVGRRQAIEDFVADIPLETSHPSRRELDRISTGLHRLGHVPVAMLWGPNDPVFSDRYLADLVSRLPHAAVHRYEGASHLVIEDAPRLVGDMWSWLASIGEAGTTAPAPVNAQDREPLTAELARRARTSPHGVCLAEPDGSGFRHITWSQMDAAVDALARGLVAEGVQRGDRVAVLVTPGADLVALVYACWRIGAVVVVTDAGLGVKGIFRALRGARPDVVVAIPRAMALVRATGLPGKRIKAAGLATLARSGSRARSSGVDLPEPPEPLDDAVVAFTSGSTGPAKGVVYKHRQVEATRNILKRHYGIGDDDSLVAAFAPWAVLGPALGIASVIPDMDVTSPRTLRASAFADAVAEVGGTLAWASPAAFRSILRTSSALDPEQRGALGSLRLLLGAGAPVGVGLLEGMQQLCPDAEVRTPYGMTEVLPVCDVNLADIRAAGTGPGVLVGSPLEGVRVRISAVDDEGAATGPLTDNPGVLGEVVVQAGHRKDRYDRLYFTEEASTRDGDWHRTGDVGVLDDAGRLWIGGRLAHVITTAEGSLAPVPVEQRVEHAVPDVVAAACVGVGPVGTQQIVVIIVREEAGRQGAGRQGAGRRPSLDADLTERVRRAADVPVVAVLERDELPVDIRHNSKVDRAALARWAAHVLAGRGTSV